jgi:hypothetical protein
MEASQTGQEECIKVLIKSEASLNVVNQDGYTALLFAQVRGPTLTLRGDVLIR